MSAYVTYDITLTNGDESKVMSYRARYSPSVSDPDVIFQRDNYAPGFDIIKVSRSVAPKIGIMPAKVMQLPTITVKGTM